MLDKSEPNYSEKVDIIELYEIYTYVKKTVQSGSVDCLYSDANSCYHVAFAEMKIPEKHTMTKRETHLIESSHSSIRDNLARFNRKTKHF